MCVCIFASFLRRDILSCVTSLALSYFSELSHIRHGFRENVIEHKMCVLIFSTFVCNISHSKKNSAVHYHKFTCIQVPVILVRFSSNWNFLNRFSTNNQTSNFAEKSVQWEPSCSMRRDRRTDGRTDVTKLIVFFS